MKGRWRDIELRARTEPSNYWGCYLSSITWEKKRSAWVGLCQTWATEQSSCNCATVHAFIRNRPFAGLQHYGEATCGSSNQWDGKRKGKPWRKDEKRKKEGKKEILFFYLIQPKTVSEGHITAWSVMLVLWNVPFFILLTQLVQPLRHTHTQTLTLTHTLIDKKHSNGAYGTSVTLLEQTLEPHKTPPAVLEPRLKVVLQPIVFSVLYFAPQFQFTQIHANTKEGSVSTPTALWSADWMLV